MMPSLNTLLTSFDSLDHNQRQERICALAREHAQDPRLHALLDQLQDDDTNHRLLALRAATVIKDQRRILSMIDDPRVSVRNTALSAAIKTIDDTQLLCTLVLNACPDARRRMLELIVRHRRRALAQALYPSILERFGPRRASVLLPFLPKDQLTTEIDRLGHALINWRRMALSYPALTFEILKKTLQSTPARARRAIWWDFSKAIAPLTQHNAQALLQLVIDNTEDFTPHCIQTALGALSRKAPEAVIQMLVRPKARQNLHRAALPKGILRNTDAFTLDQLQRLAKALFGAPMHMAALLQRTAPSTRGQLFDAFCDGHQIDTICWPDQLLDALPEALRHREARRMATLPEIQRAPRRQIALLAFKPIENVLEDLKKAAFASKAEDRSLALTTMVLCAGRCRRGLTDVLQHLGRLKNEQDPVRMAVYHALAGVPMAAFDKQHAPALTQLVDFAMEARDTSYSTRHSICRLAHRLMCDRADNPQNPLFTFALETLKKLAGHSGIIDFPRLDLHLPRGVEHKIVAALLPWLQAAAKREANQNILRLGHALGRRGWHVQPLQDLLGQLTRSQLSTEARQAITLWLQCPQTRDKRVRQLIDQDASVMTIHTVYNHLHLRRQSWLDPILEGKPLRGRFTTGKTIWCPPFTRGFQRWLTRQQHALTDIATKVATSTKHPDHERTAAIAQIAQIPTTTVQTLAPFLRSDKVNTVEAALGGLVWLDRPAMALPVLLDNLQGDRARVAMYAMPRLARLISASKLLESLQGLLGRERLKITVHKEAVRLLGAHRHPQSLTLLRQQWNREKLHRDVRIAVLHATRQLLDQQEAWDLLEAAAGFTADAYIGLALLDARPVDIHVRHRSRYLKLILQLSQHPQLEVRQRLYSVLSYENTLAGTWSTHNEAAIAKVTAEAIANLDEKAWSHAVSALMTTCGDPQANAQVQTTVASLMAALQSQDPSPSKHRDQPARQRLKRLTAAITALPTARRTRLSALYNTCAALMLADPTLIGPALRLQITALPWENPHKIGTSLVQIHRIAPLWTPHALHQPIAQAWNDIANRWTLKDVTDTLDALLAQGQHGALAAMNLLRHAGLHHHWPTALRARLTALRQSPSMHIRTLAFELCAYAE